MIAVEGGLESGFHGSDDQLRANVTNNDLLFDIDHG